MRISQRKPAPRDDIELRQLRVIMAERNLPVRELARMSGFSARRVSNVLVGNDPTWPIRAAINEALSRRIFRKPSKTQ